MGSRRVQRLTGWGQLGKALGRGGVGPRAVRLDGADEDEVRRVLSAHFRKVPGHAPADFGAAVEFDSVEEYRVHHARLDTLYETREVARRVRPHAGEALPPCRVTEVDADPWAYDNAPPDGFEATTQELTIPDSHAAVGCESCRGAGGIACEVCGAKGKLRCPCRTGTAACPRCTGGLEKVVRGTKTVPKKCTSCRQGMIPGMFVDSPSTPCPRCSGGTIYETVPDEHLVTCRGCAGKGQVACSTCRGTTVVPCAPPYGRCGGSGRLTCRHCLGSGKVVTFLAIVRTFTAATAAKAAGEGVPAPAVKEMARTARFDPGVELVATVLPAGEEPASGNPALDRAVGKLLASATGGTPDGGRVARVRLTLGASHALKLTSSYAGSTYDLWLLGRERAVYAPASPLTEAMGEKVREAVELWNGGQERKAALALRDALDMAETDADCRAAYEGLSGEVPRLLRERGERATTVRRWVKRNPVLAVVLSVLLVSLALPCVGGMALVLFGGPRERRAEPPPEWADRGPQVADNGPPRPLDRPGPGEKSVSVGFVDREVFLEAGQTGKLTVAIDRWKTERYGGELTLVFEVPADLTVPARVKVGKGQLEVEVPVTAGTRPGKYSVRVVPEGVKQDPLATDCCIVTVTEPLRPPVPKAPPADRPAAERALRLGGTVTVVPVGKGQAVVKDAATLPPGEFRLVAVSHLDRKLADADLAFLVGCRHLQVLDLTRTGVGDAGMEHLAGLTSLEQLALGVTKVTDVGVGRLAGLTNLRALHLPHTGVTDAGLKHLMGMTELRFLSLHDTAVSDAGLPVLRGLPRLTEVRLGNTKVTPAEAERMREFLTGRKKSP